MKLSYIIISIALCCSFCLQAQQTSQKDTLLNRVLTLEREYNPTIKDASKMNSLPEIKEPEAPKAQIEYSNFAIPFDVKPEISLLQANKYYTNLLSSKKRGYLNAGVSTFVDIDGDLGYQILNGEKDQLSIFGSHRSSNGNVEFLQTNEKQKMKINDNLIGLNYWHDFGILQLNADAKYTYSGFNYYGYGVSDTLLHSVPDQTNNIFDINMGISSQRENEFCYLLSLNYSYFNQKNNIVPDFVVPGNRSSIIHGPIESFFKINWDFHKAFDSDKQLGVKGYFNNSSYSLPAEHKLIYTDYDNYSDVNLNPYFAMEGDNWDMRLGVLVDILFNQSKSINLAPDIEFTFRPKEKLALYVTANGGVNNNSNKNIFYENRYVKPDYRVSDSYTGFDGTFGIKSSLLNNFWFDLFAGYKYTQQEHFYLPYGVVLNSAGIYYINDIRPKYSDAGTFKLGANLKYQFQNIFDIGIKATYYAWSVKDLDNPEWTKIPNPKAWNKPTFESDLFAGFQIPDLPLRFDLNYHLETGRKTYFANEIINMKNINQLDITGTYTINDTFSLFAKANNLLFQEYDLWYGYPAANFSIMGGINIRF